MSMLTPVFKAQQGPTDQDRLLVRADQVLPGLRFPLPTPSGLGLTTELGDPGLCAMCDFWARAYPEAGQHYLAMRCWGLAIWQPVYLCVLTAHLDNQVPKLNGAWQSWSDKDGFTHGLWLPSHNPLTGLLTDRITFGATEIAHFCSQMRDAMQSMLNLKNKTVDATLAECVLAALLLAGRYTHADTNLIRAWADRWLDGIGITNGCGLLIYEDAWGNSALMLNRTICCHNFRRRDGDKCASCPKLTHKERIARTLAETR
ncbi:siderophore ferric iron reductase [Alcaligenaceae bacterium]|nr:siderophore ferric iron reductase [Alcaligenaceae bacterium]